MAFVKFEGLTELQDALISKENLAPIRKVVQMNGQRLHSTMQNKAVFRKGYSTGETQRSISLDIKSSGLIAEVGPETNYSPYVEYGTRYMEAQPFVRPAFNQVKLQFRSDLERIMK